MPGIMDFARNNPYALLGLAQGLLAPGPNTGARLAAGLGGFGQGMASQLQFNQVAEAQTERERRKAALERMARGQSAYEAETVTPMQTPIPGAGQQSPFVSAAGQPVNIPSQNSLMGDLMTIAPEKMAEAQIKRMTGNGMEDLPASIQEMLLLAQSPELMALKRQLDPTSPEALLSAAGLQPGTNAAREFLGNRGRNTTMIDMKQESAFEGAEGQRYSKDIFGPLSTAAVNSNVNLQKIQRAKDMLANFDSGATANVTGQLSNLAQSLGIDPGSLNLDKAAPKEAFAALSNDFVLAEMERLKGVASDSDVKMLKSMQAQVGGTPEGNMLILDMAERLWSRANTVNRVAQDYLGTSGGKPRGVEKAIEEYWKANPLYAPEEAANIDRFLGQNRQPMSPAAIKLMSADDLAKVDVTKLSREQAAAFRLRATMLGRTQ